MSETLCPHVLSKNAWFGCRPLWLIGPGTLFSRVINFDGGVST
jgi:hypothetical protein